MKIESTKPYGINSGRKINKNSSVNSSFLIKSDEDLNFSDKINDNSSIGSLSSLDSLLAIQEVNDATSSNQKAIFKGKKILNLLDELKFGLLNGRIPESKLDLLLNTVKSHNFKTTEPRISAILDEIELRASVELAKLGK